MKPLVIAAVFCTTLFAAGHSAAADTRAALRFTGVNISGAEFGEQNIPGRYGTDYFYPEPATIDYFLTKGMNIARMPFRWERLQRTLGAEFDVEEFERLDKAVRYATSRGMNVILDARNHAAYLDRSIGAPEVPIEAFADLWRRLALRYRDQPLVLFGLMNEPKGLPTETWLEAANAAIAEIRRAGAPNLILVPGNGWSGAHNWSNRHYGTPNAEVMLKIVDPGDNVAYEVHQYLDADYSGTSPQCQNERIGVTTLQPFTQWLRDHGKRGFLGEFGGGSDPVCLAALDAMLTHLIDHRDVWLGWAYWAAGPWPRDYFTSLQPIGGTDRAQMPVLLKYVAPASDQAAK